jgi:hypothetical protein
VKKRSERQKESSASASAAAIPSRSKADPQPAMVLAAEILSGVADRLGAGEMKAAMRAPRHRLGPACGGRGLATPVRCAHQRVNHGNHGKKSRNFATAFNSPQQSEMVGARGFEPPTPASRTQYSTRLSYAPTAGWWQGRHCGNGPEVSVREVILASIAVIKSFFAPRSPPIVSVFP